MEWAVLIVGVVGVLVGTPVLLGVIYPPRALALGVIKGRLYALGVNSSSFSAACLAELAETSIALAKSEAIAPSLWRNHLQGAAESTADLVHDVLVGRWECSAERIREAAAADTSPWVWRVLAKHDPERFSLANLEATQSKAVRRS